MARPIGLVLAGGASARMGCSKAELVVGGRPLAARAADVAAEVCRGLVVSVAPGARNPVPGYPAVDDRPPAGRGPLAGILAGFEATEARDLLVLACDYPRVAADLLRALIDARSGADDVVLPVDSAGRDHPLVAVWHRRTEPRIREALVRGRFRVGELLAELSVRRLRAEQLGVEGAAEMLFNLNRPGDLERLENTAFGNTRAGS